MEMGSGDGCLILAVEGNWGEALNLRTLQLPPGPGQSSILPGFGGKINLRSRLRALSLSL